MEVEVLNQGERDGCTVVQVCARFLLHDYPLIGDINVHPNARSLLYLYAMSIIFSGLSCLFDKAVGAALFFSSSTHNSTTVISQLTYTHVAQNELEVHHESAPYKKLFRGKSFVSFKGCLLRIWFQVYAHDPKGVGVVRYNRRLVGFMKVRLAPGAVQHVTVNLTADALAFVSAPPTYERRLFIGTYKLFVAQSAYDPQEIESSLVLA